MLVFEIFRGDFWDLWEEIFEILFWDDWEFFSGFWDDWEFFEILRWLRILRRFRDSENLKFLRSFFEKKNFLRNWEICWGGEIENFGRSWDFREIEKFEVFWGRRFWECVRNFWGVFWDDVSQCCCWLRVFEIEFLRFECECCWVCGVYVNMDLNIL